MSQIEQLDAIHAKLLALISRAKKTRQHHFLPELMEMVEQVKQLKSAEVKKHGGWKS